MKGQLPWSQSPTDKVAEIYCPKDQGYSCYMYITRQLGLEGDGHGSSYVSEWRSKLLQSAHVAIASSKIQLLIE
jgi:hypothetical protein